MPGVCHYQASWEETYEWLAPVKTDPKSAHCKICVKSFRIDNSGKNGKNGHFWPYLPLEIDKMKQATLFVNIFAHFGCAKSENLRAY